MANPDVVFVGAGPIGLWAAIILKYAYPNKHITLIEKHEIPQREQVLSLDKPCFGGPHEMYPLIKQFIDGVHPNIKICELEIKLRELAKSINIQFDFSSVNDCQSDLLDKYPQTKVFVGSDGIHSIVRKFFFEEAIARHNAENFDFDFELTPNPALNEKCQHVAFAHYQVEGKTRWLTIEETLKLKLNLDHRIFLLNRLVMKKMEKPMSL